MTSPIDNDELFGTYQGDEEPLPRYPSVLIGLAYALMLGLIAWLYSL